MIFLKSATDLTGYTLILPAVSVGNVGQLAVDLMISTLNCNNLGHIWHPAILPAVGDDPFEDLSKALITGCQIYTEDVQKLVFLQFRAPILTRHTKSLLETLLVWINSNKFAKVVILSGSTFTEGCDSLIAGVKQRYLITKDLYAVNRVEIEKKYWAEAPIESGKVFLPSSGYAKPLFAMLEEAGIPTAIMINYCSEGNNIPDAYLLADYVNEWMSLLPTAGLWKEPPSWKHMYGNTPDRKRIF